MQEDNQVGGQGESNFLGNGKSVRMTSLELKRRGAGQEGGSNGRCLGTSGALRMGTEQVLGAFV